MTENNHLCDLWEHTIAKIFKHDPKSELGLMLNEWVKFNKLENFNSLLNIPLMMLHHLVIYVISIKIVKFCIKHHCMNFSPKMVHTTSHG